MRNTRDPAATPLPTLSGFEEFVEFVVALDRRYFLPPLFVKLFGSCNDSFIAIYCLDLVTGADL